MYAKFYGLSESPFALTPDPRYLFLSEPHREALASATYGVQERKGFVLILGEVGTGKTTIIRHLLGRFGPDIRTVFVFNPAVSFLELLQLMLRDLELPCPSVRRVEMMETLNEYLLKEAMAGRYVVLIIDEAQHLSPAVLEEVRMLSNLETARGKLIQILLVGQPELGEKLGRPELRQLRQRIGLVAELKPLSRKETAEYIAHRLDVAGHPGQQIFTRRALKIIHRSSAGIPRLVNVICDKALLLAYGAGTKKVGGRLVKEVLKDWAPFRRRGATPDARARGRSMAPRTVHSAKPFWKVAGVAVAGLALTSSYFVFAGQQDSDVLRRLKRAIATGTSATVMAANETPAPSVPALPPRVVARADTKEPARVEPVTPPPTTTLAAPEAKPAPLPVVPVTAIGSREPAPEVAATTASSRDADREIVVKPGEILSALVMKRYGRADLTLLDFVRQANPDLASIDVLRVGQRLRFPAAEPRAFVEQKDASHFRVHVVTVEDTQSGAFHELRSALERSGRQVYVVPITLTGNDQTYRVLVGDFASRRDAETFYRNFRFPVWATTQLWR